MPKVTILAVALTFLWAGLATAQQTEYVFNVPQAESPQEPYSADHSGARAVAGPYDLDGDGAMEVLVSDYTGGGRVHVIENTGVDAWEWAYSTPWLDSTATTENIRAIAGGDLDGDGMGEIYFLGGRGLSETNPNIASLPPGLYVFEFNGTDFGDLPASVYEFDGDLPDRWRAEQMAVVDVDGDGQQELMFGNNGSDNRYDNWYVLSVTGDIGSGFEVWTQEVRLSSRNSEDFDPVDRGGGSPYAIHPADLNGDGIVDLSMHSWNSFNFTNGMAVGDDDYMFPAEGDTNVFVHASPEDDVSFFGGTVIDIDQDGNEEIFYPNLNTGNVSLLNYDATDNVLLITQDHVAYDVIMGLTSLGITSGDLDGDGSFEVIGSGPSFTADNFMAGETPFWIRIAEYNGGDITEPASYSFTEVSLGEDVDSTAFDLVRRDSAGTMTVYYEDGDQGPEFVSKLVFLGDVDNDGAFELAMAYQGIDDSTYVYDEVWEDTTYTRTLVSATPRANRIFLRIIEGTGAATAVEGTDALPTNYKLSANYPNPFNPSTTFSFTLPVDQRVSVKIYDVAGRLVRTLIDDRLYTRGTHEVTWNGRDAAGGAVASGTYLYALEYGNFRQARSMVLIK